MKSFNSKMYYIVVYENNIPILSVCSDKKINKREFIRKHNLNKNIKIEINKKDIFIGW